MGFGLVTGCECVATSHGTRDLQLHTAISKAGQVIRRKDVSGGQKGNRKTGKVDSRGGRGGGVLAGLWDPYLSLGLAFHAQEALGKLPPRFGAVHHYRNSLREVAGKSDSAARNTQPLSEMLSRCQKR